MPGRTSQTATDGVLRSVAADALASALILLAILLLVLGGTALARPKLTDAAGRVVGCGAAARTLDAVRPL